MSRISRESIESAARRHGDVLELHRLRCVGTDSYRFTIRRKPGEKKWSRLGYIKHEKGGRMRVGRAVCWHGHYAFIQALFEEEPQAVVETSLITYRGADDFRRRAPGTFNENAYACNCEQE